MVESYVIERPIKPESQYWKLSGYPHIFELNIFYIEVEMRWHKLHDREAQIIEKSKILVRVTRK